MASCQPPGTASKAGHIEPGSNVNWEIHVEPNGNGALSITPPPTTDWDGNDVCTSDGRRLSNAVSVAVAGP